jgi:hypothetical protein
MGAPGTAPTGESVSEGAISGTIDLCTYQDHGPDRSGNRSYQVGLPPTKKGCGGAVYGEFATSTLAPRDRRVRGEQLRRDRRVDVRRL